MNPINVIIFSMNRAAQLDALLQSIQRFAPWLWPPTVLFRYTSEAFLKGYTVLHRYHQVPLVWQLPLKERVLGAIDRSISLTTMLVDDSVFFRPVPVVSDLPANTCYAWRLGSNVTYCYPMDRPQKEGELDFAYSLTIDGHCYRTEEIWNRIAAIDFASPNQLEEYLTLGTPLTIQHPERSCIVSIPHNRVGEYPNRFGGGSAMELNDRFLSGERIDTGAMDFSSVRGAHQEIPYVWKKAL